MTPKVKEINISNVKRFAQFCGSFEKTEEDLIEYKRRLIVLQRCLTQFEKADIRGVSAEFKTEYVSTSGIRYKIDLSCDVYDKLQANIDVYLVSQAVIVLLLKIEDVKVTRAKEVALMISQIKGQELTPDQIKTQTRKWYTLIQDREEGEEIPDIYNIFSEAADIESLEELQKIELNADAFREGDLYSYAETLREQYD